MEQLTIKLDGKVVVSLDEVNWEEARYELQWAILVKLASGKPIRKAALVDVFEKVWKLKQSTEFYKVEKKHTTGEVYEQGGSGEGASWSLEGEGILLQR